MSNTRRSHFNPGQCDVPQSEYNAQFAPKLAICERNLPTESTRKYQVQLEKKAVEQEQPKPEDTKPKPLRYVWTNVGEIRIMTVFRKNVATVPVRMLETLLLRRLDRALLLHMFSRLHLCESSYMTEPEAWLFNLLKDQHCAYGAARRLVFDTDDRVVTLTDALGLEKILHICDRRKLMNRNFSSEHFGYVIISNRWLPYVVIQQRRWFPIYPLERDMRTLALSKCEDIKNWDLAWLKLGMRLIGEPLLMDRLCECPCIMELDFKQVCEENGKDIDLTERWPISEVFHSLPNVNRGLSLEDFVWTKMPPTPAYKMTAEWYRQNPYGKN